TREERTAALAAFASGTRRVLLTTDTAGEGLNLHHACRVVINLELPWNPMRLEQRIGRVDRIGQRRTVHAFHLIARNTGETQILERLRIRLTRAKADFGAPDPLGSDPERAVRFLLIDGVDSDNSSPAPGGLIEMVRPEPRLAEAAAAEVVRLEESRRLIRNGDEAAMALVEGFGPAISISHRWRTRSSLTGRVILLYRVSGEDGFGRLAMT